MHVWGGGGGGLCDIPRQKKAYLMRIAIEGPDLSAVNFDDIFTGKSDCRLYSCVRIIIMNFFGDSWGGRSDLWGGISPPPPPPPLLYETLVDS